MTDDDDIYAEASPPTRFKEIGELTVAELIEWRKSGRLPETPEYVARRREVLERNGLADADDQQPPDLEAMTPEDHARRKYPASN